MKIYNTEDLSDGIVQMKYNKDKNRAAVVFRDINPIMNFFGMWDFYRYEDKSFIHSKSADPNIPTATESEILTVAEYREAFKNAIIGRSFWIKTREQAKWLLEMVEKWTEFVLFGEKFRKPTETSLLNLPFTLTFDDFNSSFHFRKTGEKSKLSTLTPFGYEKPQHPFEEALKKRPIECKDEIEFNELMKLIEEKTGIVWGNGIKPTKRKFDINYPFIIVGTQNMHSRSDIQIKPTKASKLLKKYGKSKAEPRYPLPVFPPVNEIRLSNSVQSIFVPSTVQLPHIIQGTTESFVITVSKNLADEINLIKIEKVTVV